MIKVKVVSVVIVIVFCLGFVGASFVAAAPAAIKRTEVVSPGGAFGVPRASSRQSFDLGREPIVGMKVDLPDYPLVKIDINVLGKKYGVTDSDIARVVMELREIAVLSHQTANKYRNRYYSDELLPAAAIGEWEVRRRAALVPAGASFTADNLLELRNCHRSIRNKIGLLASAFDRIVSDPRNAFMDEAFVYSTPGGTFMDRCRQNIAFFGQFNAWSVFVEGFSINPYFAGNTLLEFSLFLNENYIRVDTADGNAPTSATDWAEATVVLPPYGSTRGEFLDLDGARVGWGEFCEAKAEFFDLFSEGLVQRVVELGGRPPVF
ncbi:MAG: hypothetical protein ABIH69_03715 [bacterium]